MASLRIAAKHSSKNCRKILQVDGFFLAVILTALVVMAPATASLMKAIHLLLIRNTSQRHLNDCRDSHTSQASCHSTMFLFFPHLENSQSADGGSDNNQKNYYTVQKAAPLSLSNFFFPNVFIFLFYSKFHLCLS